MKYILYALPTALLVLFACALSRGAAPHMSRAERDSSLVALHRQIHSLRSVVNSVEASRPPTLPRGIGQ